MDRWRGKVAVVTGASAGIGQATVTKLVEAGVKVVGLARRLDKIEALSKKLSGFSGRLYPIKCDITKEEDIIGAFKWIKGSLGPVHILINNAGVARPTQLIDGSTEEWKRVIDTNFLGLSICSREAVRHMQEGKVAGHIVHVSSVAGYYVPMILQNNVYPATKHAVRALADTLRMELNLIDSEIKVSCVSPGMVATEIVDANGFVLEGLAKEAFDICPKLSSVDVADAIMYVIGTPKSVHIQDIIIRPTGEKL